MAVLPAGYLAFGLRIWIRRNVNDTRKKVRGCCWLALALLVLTIVVMELAPGGEGTEGSDCRYNFTLDPDQVTSLTWQYEEETISLEKDQENNWTYPADAAFPWTRPIRMRWCRP